MKTFQIFEEVSREYFVIADSYDDAITKIEQGKVIADNEEVVDFRLVDIHDGDKWENE